MSKLLWLICLLFAFCPISSQEQASIYLSSFGNKIVYANVKRAEGFPELLLKYKSLDELIISSLFARIIPNEFANLKKLNSLEIEYSQLTDYDHFSTLLNKMNIQLLRINHCGLRSLRTLKSNSLKILDLSNNNISDFPEYLISNNNNLDDLRLDNNKIAGIRISRTNTVLKKLSLSSNIISEIKGLVHLKSLESLVIGDNPLDLKMLVYQINEMKNLKELYLSGTYYIDQYKQLKNIKNLEFLYLNITAFTNEQIVELKEALPGTCIEHY